MKQIIYSNQEEKLSKQVEGLIEEQERILAQAQKAAQNCPEGSLKVQKKKVEDIIIRGLPSRMGR